jgi:hypothetical protein
MFWFQRITKNVVMSSNKQKPGGISEINNVRKDISLKRHLRLFLKGEMIISMHKNGLFCSNLFKKVIMCWERLILSKKSDSFRFNGKFIQSSQVSIQISWFFSIRLLSMKQHFSSTFLKNAEIF